jgi:Flp pilus assembly protein TadD
METTDTLKEKGNLEFKKGNFQAAIAHYTEALLNEKNEVFYGNRAA